jgi:signal transduction histidine kinase
MHRHWHGRRGHVFQFGLQRRIFMWFGATILLTVIVVGALMGATAREVSWRRDLQRAQSFVSDNYAQAWDDPPRRDVLTQTIARDLDFGVRVTDASGAPLGAAGATDATSAIGGGPWKVPVVRDGQTVGFVYLSAERYAGHPWKVALALFAAGVVIWGASGAIARRLSRPFAELARVADELGAGNFAARVTLPARRGPHRHAGEATVLAASINAMAEKIEKQFRDQRELLAAVSHEIRTPLARIRLLLELAREKGIDDPGLSEVDREVVEMDVLVAELLASSRLDFSAMTPKELDAVDVAGRALEREGLARALLQAEFPEGAPRRVRADATLLARALSNIVENAKGHGGGLTALRVVRKGDAIAFEALDAGPGFTKEEAARVFDSFFRGKPGSDEKPSLGLGLSLVRRIAEAHGGSAYAESRPEGGARVGFTIPAA